MEIDYNIPVIDSDKQYWFIRTYSGAIFEDYYNDGYVGLGMNNVPQRLIKQASPEDPTTMTALRNFIHGNTSHKSKPSASKAANDLISFEHEMKIGDMVIVPSKHSAQLAIGIVESDVYLVENTGTFTFRNQPERYPEKRRRIKWQRVIRRSDLNGDLRGLISSWYGITNANRYRDIFESTVDSLYVRNDHAYFTIKIDQDEDINAFVLSRFLDGLTYFYTEFCKESGIEVNEDFTIKIKLQSKGSVALKAAVIGGVVGIAGLIVLSSNMDVKLNIGNVKVEGKSDGFLKSLSNFLDANQERKIRLQKFVDSTKQLQAKRYDDSLDHVNSLNHQTLPEAHTHRAMLLKEEIHSPKLLKEGDGQITKAEGEQ